MQALKPNEEGKPLYLEILGSEFDRLHPKLQWRYGIHSGSGVAQIGTGMMDSVYANKLLPFPFRTYFSKRNAMPRKTSRLVPYTMRNYCYQDESGRECVAVLREFQYANRVDHLNSVLVSGMNGLVDYFGDGPEFLYPMEARVGAGGSLVLESGPIRFLKTGRKFGMLDGFLGATIRYTEAWDERTERFRANATIRNPILGELFHFRGWFSAVEEPCSAEQIPDAAWPFEIVEREY